MLNENVYINVREWKRSLRKKFFLSEITTYKRFCYSIYLPKCPIDIEAHGIQPKKCRKKKKLHTYGWKFTRFLGD